MKNFLIQTTGIFACLLMFAGCSKGPERDLEKRIFVNHASLDMYVGEEVQITASPTTLGTFIWETEDNSVATVSQNGEVRATGEGETNIIVTCGELRRIIPVKSVEWIPATGISISTPPSELQMGGAIVLKVTFLPENNTEKDKSLIWESSNPSIATVSGGGVVVAVSQGGPAVISVAMKSNPEKKIEIPISVYTLKTINVVAGKPVTHSDCLSAYTGSMAVDGIGNLENNEALGSSRWVTADGEFLEKEHWIDIDLQATYAINAMKMFRDWSTPTQNMKQFSLQAWVNGAWIDVVSETNAVDNKNYETVFDPVTTNRVRLYFPAGVDNRVRLFELEVYSTKKVFYDEFNVVLNKTIAEESDCLSPYNGQKAIDGDRSGASSRWVSDDSNSEHYIVIDLGRNFTISSFQMWRDLSSPTQNMPQYRLQAWVDGVWKTVFSEDNALTYSGVFEPVATDKIRLYFPAYTNNRIRLFELEVYGY